MHDNIYVRNLYFKYHLEISLCPNYVYNKQTRGRFPKWGGGGQRTNFMLNLVHSNVCGPMQVESHQGFKYFLTFIDNKSRKTYIQNWIPTNALDGIMTLEEEWIRIKPSLFYLKIFGFDAYVHISKDKRKKLEYKN